MCIYIHIYIYGRLVAGRLGLSRRKHALRFADAPWGAGRFC